jgi:predicted dehydrogenase
MDHSHVNRRDFLKTSGKAAAATSAVAGLAATAASASAAKRSETLRIGFIGPGSRGFKGHVQTLAQLKKDGANIELAAVSEVYTKNRQRATDYITQETGKAPGAYVDYREMFAKEKLDAVCVATPDHWHATQTIDALNEGLHVYCEKPMTHSVEEATDVVRAWQRTGKVMQVGVQSTSLPLWSTVREELQKGTLGKVLMYQTEFFRNSAQGQWRAYKLTKEMSPKTINWPLWLGVEQGLAPDLPFDRAVFAQWRRFWPFGSGMYTDLFVHRTTSMLKATGLRYPGRVVGAGGIFLEYDGRDVPDVATVVADFREGVQGMVTATMCCENTPIRQLIRGHNGSFVFGNGEEFEGFDFVPERSQITRDSSLKPLRTDVALDDATLAHLKSDWTPQRRKGYLTTYLHFKNWLDAVRAEDQQICNNPPDLGAAAIVTVKLGSRSYREGKAFFFDADRMQVSDADSSWADNWERMSQTRAKPNHIAGWKAGEKGSLLEEPAYMALAGPWKNGRPPAAN